MDLTWDELHVSIGDKNILHGISGVARSGRMLAVMGATGSGKTTLLTNLAARGSEYEK